MNDHETPPSMDFNVPYHSGKQSVADSWEAFQLAWQRLVGEVGRVYEAEVVPFARKLREAGLLPEDPPTEDPPTDPKQRALWARQNRSTGPARPSGQNAHAPRRHK